MINGIIGFDYGGSLWFDSIHFIGIYIIIAQQLYNSLTVVVF